MIALRQYYYRSDYFAGNEAIVITIASVPAE